jgi:hypothetical protein
VSSSPDHISGPAVLESGPTEILPPVGAISKPLRVSADPVAKPAAHTRAESRGSRPSKPDAGERQTLRWREMDSNHRFLARKSRFLLWKANCGDRTGVAKKGCFLCGTDGSNPSPSTGESAANLTFGPLSSPRLSGALVHDVGINIEHRPRRLARGQQCPAEG